MFTLNCKGRVLSLHEPVVMGIINVTPDSFYKGSRFNQEDSILAQAEKMINEGATILDIGGQSTRPGSVQVSVDEELGRVVDAVRAIADRFPSVFISIDTFYGKVAKEAVDAGASIVNDISAGSIDNALIETVAELKVPYILMHMQGTPSTMQKEPKYRDVTKEVLEFLIRKKESLATKGIRDVIFDPGFGFGKTSTHNFTLLRNLRAFTMSGAPLLAGLSRKGMIYKTIGTTAEESLNGTTVLNSFALLGGANILRVHDVKPAMEAIKLFRAFQGSA